MSRERILSIVIGLTIAIGAAGAILWFNRGARMVLEGNVQKVRTQALDEATAVIVDFRVTNPADYRFVVAKVELYADLDGNQVEGAVVADIDAKRFFSYYPAIGQKYNDTLKSRENLAPKQAVDRMLAARFEVPESRLLSRRNLKIRIEEVDGAVTEIWEKKQ